MSRKGHYPLQCNILKPLIPKYTYIASSIYQIYYITKTKRYLRIIAVGHKIFFQKRSHFYETC